jgi:hypothetical protein
MMQKFMLYFLFIFSFSFAKGNSQESAILAKLDSLNVMREALASGVSQLKQSEVTEQTFKEVCQPVGLELKRWAGEKGYQARQISLKPRGLQSNPLPYEIEILKTFEKNASKSDYKYVVTEADIQKVSVYKRINVAQSCLACHGDKKLRPDFIKEKYPKDQACGFKAGDFRGLFVVSFSN